jgi:hypothetical protein
MARQYALFENLKSMVGTALIGLGLFVVYGNLTDAAARLSRFAGISAEANQTLGELTAVGLAASQAFQSYLFDRAGFLRGLCKILISFWPLLLVIAGAVLTGMASGTTPRNVQNKIIGDVDRAGDRSTPQ